MIKIINWLLTRKCNIKCGYCRITRDYHNSPYPNLKYFFNNEMSTDFIINGLEWFKNYNPYCFHIFYGGEPLLRQDLSDIINYCNKNNIFYTIISNNTNEIQPLVKKLFSSVDYIEGFTTSIDPVIYDNNKNSSRYNKSIQGYKNLLSFINGIKDPVAEITIDNSNIDGLFPLIENLTSNNINSDITFIDISKNKYYDFSNITDHSILVNQSDKLLILFEKIIFDKLNVHMSNTILPELFKILPSNFDCNIENGIHNLTIDSDGSIRLCLRIRGIETPKKKLFDYILDNILKDDLLNNLKIDKINYCNKCNWTCPIMSSISLIDNNEIIHVSIN